MMAKTAGGRPGRSAASRAKKTPGAARTPPAPRETPEDFSDVMQALDRVSARNDELAERIDRLVTSLR